MEALILAIGAKTCCIMASGCGGLTNWAVQKRISESSYSIVVNEFKNIVFLEEVIQQKLRKEQELVFYENELEKLQSKLGYLKQEIKLTNLIIDLVSSENILDTTAIPEKLNTIEHLSTKIEKQ